jgi:peptide/nickel transport system substrate-binding protein
MFKRSFHVVLTSLALSAVAGLGLVSAQSTLVIGTGAELSHLDPRLATDIPSFERINVISEPLVTFGNDLGLNPRLATSWELAADGLSLTFNLREGVKFHDGTDFTSEDVRYTFEWVLNEGNASPNRALYADIESIDTPDAHTVVMNLSNANSFLLNNIARMPIVPASAGENEDFTFNSVGTGPYKFESLRRDDRMVLHAFDAYWGGRGEIDVVEFRPIPEDGTRLLAFEAGDIDISQSQPVPTELDRLMNDDRFIIERAPGTGYTYVGMNNTSAPLDNKLVRQAISHLVHRDAIVSRVLNGIGQPGISMLSPELAWFNPDVPAYPYDPERARELLAEAGIDTAGTRLRLYTNENPVRMQIAEILQAEMAGIGLELEVNIEEFGAFLERVQTTNDFDLFILGWSGQLDPDRSMQRQFTSTGASNYTNYANDRVDELLAEGRITATDSQLSLDIYNEAQMIVLEEAPYAFVNYTEEIAMSHPWVEGWSIHTYGANAYQDLHLVRLNR